MKKIIFFVLVAFVHFKTSGQTKVAIKDLSSMMVPADPGNNESVVSVDFMVLNPSNINFLDINIGSSKGANDIATIRLSYIMKDGIEYLKLEDRQFYLVGGKARVDTKIPKEKSFGSGDFINISGKDISGLDIIGQEIELR